MLGIALSMDAFAVSVACAMARGRGDFLVALKLGIAFGGFQAAMPAAGFYLSSFAYEYISGVDHWIAFGLLAFIGGKMIAESLSSKPEENSDLANLGICTIAVLAVATSIDALAVGISLACIKVNVLFPAAVIGVITFLLSFLGALFGAKIGAKIGKRAELAGGLILVAIGTRILFAC